MTTRPDDDHAPEATNLPDLQAEAAADEEARAHLAARCEIYARRCAALNLRAREAIEKGAADAEARKLLAAENQDLRDRLHALQERLDDMLAERGDGADGSDDGSLGT